jgi:hypothetical protein
MKVSLAGASGTEKKIPPAGGTYNGSGILVTG